MSFNYKTISSSALRLLLQLSLLLPALPAFANLVPGTYFTPEWIVKTIWVTEGRGHKDINAWMTRELDSDGEVRYRVFYRSRAAGGRIRSFSIDPDEFLSDIAEYIQPGDRWQVPRKSGGFTAARAQGLVFLPEEGTDRGVFDRLIWSFHDFQRERTEGGRRGRPKFTDKGYAYEMLANSRPTNGDKFSWKLPADIRDQRFVLDFHTGTVVPILVMGYRDGNAVFTTIDYRFQAESLGSRSLFYQGHIYVADARILRLLPDEEAYIAAASAYFNGSSKVSDIVRANRAHIRQFEGRELSIRVTDNISGSFYEAGDALSDKPEFMDFTGSACDPLRAVLEKDYTPIDD